METNQSLTSQNLTGSENQPQQTGSNQKLFVAVVISVLLTSMLTGSAVYFWQKSVNENTTTELHQKISTLEEQISRIRNEETATQPIPTTDPTANLNTYSNEKHGFSFNYPQSWQINDIQGPGGLGISLSGIADGHTISVHIWRVTGFGYCYKYGERKEIIVGGKNAETADGVGGSEMCDKPEEYTNRGNTFVLIPIDDAETTFPRNQIHISYDYPLNDITLAKSNFDQILSTFKFTN